MKENPTLHYIAEVLHNMPAGWLNTTTHRLDIYEEKLAKHTVLSPVRSLIQCK
jgi:hypothetical protein